MCSRSRLQVVHRDGTKQGSCQRQNREIAICLSGQPDGLSGQPDAVSGQPDNEGSCASPLEAC
jgi:hypothetical protein